MRGQPEKLVLIWLVAKPPHEHTMFYHFMCMPLDVATDHRKCICTGITGMNPTLIHFVVCTNQIGTDRVPFAIVISHLFIQKKI